MKEALALALVAVLLACAGGAAGGGAAGAKRSASPPVATGAPCEVTDCWDTTLDAKPRTLPSWPGGVLTDPHSLQCHVKAPEGAHIRVSYGLYDARPPEGAWSADLLTREASRVGPDSVAIGSFGATPWAGFSICGRRFVVHDRATERRATCAATPAAELKVRHCEALIREEDPVTAPYPFDVSAGEPRLEAAAAIEELHCDITVTRPGRVTFYVAVRPDPDKDPYAPAPSGWPRPGDFGRLPAAIACVSAGAKKLDLPWAAVLLGDEPGWNALAAGGTTMLRWWRDPWFGE